MYTFLCEKKKIYLLSWKFFHVVWKMVVYVALKGQAVREF